MPAWPTAACSLASHGDDSPDRQLLVVEVEEEVTRSSTMLLVLAGIWLFGAMFV